MESGSELHDIPKPTPFQLQNPREFVRDFTEKAKSAKKLVGIETMQFEVCDDTRPLFTSLLQANADRVRFHYDRVASQHIEAGENKATVYRGLAIPYRGTGFREVNRAARERQGVLDELQRRDIAIETEKKGHFQHNHVKLAVADETAWFGTMNLRARDFHISNFMMRVDDPFWVDQLTKIFHQSEEEGSTNDRVLRKPGDDATEILLDAGVKGQSRIYQRAQEMVRDMSAGDEFIFVGQWPPVKVFMGSLIDELDAKVQREGITGIFLISPETELHPSQRVSLLLQGRAEKKYKDLAGVSLINLETATHAKAFMIRHKDGSSEALFGSHNLSSFTVRNGTRELSMWSRDPEITGQLDSFIAQIRGR